MNPLEAVRGGVKAISGLLYSLAAQSRLELGRAGIKRRLSGQRATEGDKCRVQSLEWQQKEF